jgi:hypothetical protein
VSNTTLDSGTLSAQALIEIVGHNAADRDLDMLAVADRVAGRFLTAKGGAFLSSSGAAMGDGNHYTSIDFIAEACDEDEIQKWERLLEKFPPITVEDNLTEHAVDVALMRWEPAIVAAYYFGLAMGLRLAAGVQ